MPMNGSQLANEIVAALGLTEPTAIEAWDTIATAIVNHIVTNGVVAVPGVKAGTDAAAGTIT